MFPEHAKPGNLILEKRFLVVVHVHVHVVI